LSAGTFALPLVGLAPTPAGQKPPGGRRAVLRQFICGPENRVLETIVQSAAERQTPFNPLVFYGPSGTGKSHLALGLARVWKTSYSGANVVYMVATDLIRSHKGAAAVPLPVRDESNPITTPAHRASDYLVVDCLDTIAQSSAAQHELAHTIDAVCQRGGRVVVIATHDPARNPALEPRLQGRLAAGLVTPISVPGSAARARIVRELALAHGIAISACCVRLLADSGRRTVPQLLGILLQLELESRTDGTTIGEDQVAALLAREPASRQVTVEMVAVAVARHFQVKKEDLKSPSRQRSLVVARGVAIYLARKYTTSSFVALGKAFGDRDHTTVMHAHHKIAQALINDAEVAAAVSELEAEIATGSATEFTKRRDGENVPRGCRPNAKLSP
jgi:chromosomal replication initiator protein